MNIAELQDRHCDYTRNTEKRFRVLRNIGEAAPYFPIDEPVLCFGSGDGFEVEVWKMLGYDVVGCEISHIKRLIASDHNVRSYALLKDISCRNVYCAHTIEHLKDRDDKLIRMWNISISVMCLIFPIEPNGSENPSHLSPVLNINDIKLPGDTLLKYERWNGEREAILIAKKRDYNGNFRR